MKHEEVVILQKCAIQPHRTPPQTVREPGAAWGASVGPVLRRLWARRVGCSRLVAWHDEILGPASACT